MSAIPAFEIGVCNAWIFMPYLFLLMILVDKLKNGEEPGKLEIESLSKSGKIIFNVAFIVLFCSVIYSIFLPLKLGTTWFYVGLPITLIGLITLTIVMFNFSTTPWGKPITKGFYRYSRHPMYITTTLFLFGVGIATASWLFLSLSILFTILNAFRAINEERFCLKQHGEGYREYMNKTPRWIGLPK
jgi:protein-S-isoprenylcysteine O-methyltransferase Ste14